MRIAILALCAACTLFGGTAARAQVSESEWEQFKAQFAAMSERVSALEAENRALRESGGRAVTVEDLAATNAEVDELKAQNSASSWSERINWKGDFRYRYEEIEEEGKDDRDRNRIRARPALIAKVSDTTEVGFGLATGNDDPVSTNQTLGDGATHKEVTLDLAYATWTGLENTAVTAGKFANPYYTVNKSQLIWDGDLRPEGFAASWTNDSLFADASYSFIESDSQDDYGAAWWIQLGAQVDPIDNMKLIAAASYVGIPSKGRTTIYDDSFFNNSSVTEDVDGDVEQVYEYDYNLINASLNFIFNVFDMPLSFYGEYVENDDVDDFNTGYLAGVQLGSAKAKGSWQLLYQYEDLEADAVFGLWTDSDFGGGGTDAKGSRLSAAYAIDDNWSVGATYFDNKTGVDLGDNASYERLQVDTEFKY